jgi:outer membrane protein
MTKYLATAAMGLWAVCAAAQPLKIGYTNAEVVLSLMPEFKAMEQALKTHEQKLIQNMNVKKTYYESKVKEYQEMLEGGKLVGDAKTKMENDIRKLEEEIQTYAEDAETNYNKKKEEMIAPILEKLQKAIDELAKEKGMTYIFNGSLAGNGIILHGPKEDNITLDLLKKLGIEPPKELLDAMQKN